MGSFDTQFEVKTSAWSSWVGDVLIVPVFQDEAALKKAKADADKKSGKSKKTDAPLPVEWTKALTELDEANAGLILTTAKEEKFSAARGKTLVFRQAGLKGFKAKRLVLLGLGVAKELCPQRFVSVINSAVNSAKSLKELSSMAYVLPSSNATISSDMQANLFVDAVYGLTYVSREAKESGLEVKNGVVFSSKSQEKNIEPALVVAAAMAKAKSLQKDLVNHPSNLKTTKTLVTEAERLGKLTGLKTTVVSDVKWIEKEMPCFYTVAIGSVATDPPKWIQVAYKPKGTVKTKIALVGKSVIFDTGGYQVKPDKYMNTMKADMTGGASVLGVMQALAELQPKGVEVTAYMAATPNKIDSHAMLPDSIVNTSCGKKVEIRHTDAEGRLTLIDAVTKASEDKPDVIVTTATLTGSAASAVGSSIALMANAKATEGKFSWRDGFEEAAKSVGEFVQTLDVTDKDYEDIESKLDGADINNTSHGKGRGAQSAAAFVMSGVSEKLHPGGLPLVHLDIAGGDMTSDDKATGIAVRGLLQFVLNQVP